jgi:hypothetical protein
MPGVRRQDSGVRIKPFYRDVQDKQDDKDIIQNCGREFLLPISFRRGCRWNACRGRRGCPPELISFPPLRGLGVKCCKINHEGSK